MAISVNVTETVIDTDVTNTDVTVALTEQTTNVELTYPGPQGASAIVNVTTPITNTGTTTEPNIGIDQTLLSLARIQIIGTAVTEAAGKALTAGTADYATTAGTSVYSTNAGTATYATNAGSATTAGTADYATLAGTAVNISGTIAPTQVTGTAAILGANTFTDQQTITPATAVTALIVNAATSASSAIGLIVKANTGGGGGSIADFYNSSGNLISNINSSGQIGVRTAGSSYGASLAVATASATLIGIVARAAASQTADLQQWQNSGGTVLSLVNSAGLFESPRFTAKPTGGTFGLYAQNASATAIGIVARGAASQTANLQEWQNDSGTVLSTVTSAGNLVVRGTSAQGAFTVYSPSTTSVAEVIRGIASQTADLTQWQKSSGLVAAKVDAFGGALFTYANIQSDNATTRPFSARAAANATANIVELQASSGTVLGGDNAVGQLWSGSTSPVTVATGGATTAASGTGTTATITTTSAHGLAVGDLVTVAGVTPTGYNATAVVTAVTSTTFSYANATTGSQTVAGTVSVPAQASVTARSAGTVGLVVKAAASQTAAMTRWLASDGSTINAQVTSTGGIAGVSVQTNNNFARIGEANSGGFAQLYKATASAVPGATDYARLFIVAGTNAGTLKLVIRAGTAGAETTILDNIPQT